MSRKWLFSAVGAAAILVVGMTWLIQGVEATGLWALWFAAINAMVGLYAGANVLQKKVISKNFHPELVEDGDPGIDQPAEAGKEGL